MDECLQDHFSIGATAETNSYCFEPATQFHEVVHLAVIDDGDRAILGFHRLVASVRQIEDAQASVSEACAAQDAHTLVIRSAVTERARHRPHEAVVHARARIIHYPTDAADGPLSCVDELKEFKFSAALSRRRLGSRRGRTAFIGSGIGTDLAPQCQDRGPRPSTCPTDLRKSPSSSRAAMSGTTSAPAWTPSWGTTIAEIGWSFSLLTA